MGNIIEKKYYRNVYVWYKAKVANHFVKIKRKCCKEFNMKLFKLFWECIKF